MFMLFSRGKRCVSLPARKGVNLFNEPQGTLLFLHFPRPLSTYLHWFSNSEYASAIGKGLPEHKNLKGGLRMGKPY